MSLVREVASIVLAAGVVCLLLVCEKGNPAAPPATDPVATELEGTWLGTNKDGIDQTLWTYTMILDSIFITGMLLDSETAYRGTFTLDTTLVPRTITITIGESSDASAIGKTIPALYQVSGNILEITANAPGSSRPASMAEAPVISLIDNN